MGINHVGGVLEEPWLELITSFHSIVLSLCGYTSSLSLLLSNSMTVAKSSGFPFRAWLDDGLPAVAANRLFQLSQTSLKDLPVRVLEVFDAS